MANETKELLLLKYFLEEIVPRMIEQITKDDARWGDTWQHRPVEAEAGWEDQTIRIFKRFNEYLDDYLRDGIPVPWEKVIGECNIAMARLDHPEWILDIDSPPTEMNLHDIPMQELLREIIRREGVSGGPIKREWSCTPVEAIIGIDRDHTASLMMHIDDYNALYNSKKEERPEIK